MNNAALRTPARLAVVFLLFSICMCLQAQQNDRIVILNHADSLVGRESEGEQIRELIGHVQFTQGKIVVRCDRAIQYTRTNRITMEGTVQVQDDSMRMVGTRGVYYGDTRIAEAFDRVLLEDRVSVLRAGYGKYFVSEKKAYFTTNVSVEDTSALLTSRELIYFREAQQLIATGDVKIFNRQNNLTTFGSRFEHDKLKKYSRMTGLPRVVQVDTSSEIPDTLSISGVVLESYQDTLERLVATDSVRIFRKELAGEAGLATFFVKRDSIILRHAPFIWYTSTAGEENQVSGDSMSIKLRKRRPERVVVQGNARAISRTDTLYPDRLNQMSGQEMTMYFRGKSLERIDVLRTATSLYFLFDKGRPNGLNKTSGDKVTMSFLDGRIDHISVIAGVEGQYFPERLIRGREGGFNLTGFNWREDHPGKNRPISPVDTSMHRELRKGL